ncbi:FAD-dependent oxidoreductase [Kribbella speibonae]|uniref:Amine oxidase domain-containing protein n=1 Tax=Kribbella speibonae TaxID=1572660 RepID=A0A4R0IXT5_9ACTN|nr:FAD-dependent oxidoreductase [Kribbella speibonae]TCC36388.1 hypothetical protein E0H92_27490 [Kribbella speibonae]
MPGLEHLDVTMAAYLSRLDLPARARELVLADSFALMGADEHCYSVLNLLHEVRGFGSAQTAFTGETARVGGGADAIARAIAAALGDAVRLGHLVERIAQNERGVVVEGATFSVEARAAVVAIPVNVLRELHPEIPFGPQAVRVLAEGHVGRAAKGWATVSGDASSVHSEGWPDAIEVYAVPGEHRAAVARFSLGEPSHDAALDRARQAMGSRHPELGTELETFSHDWITDEYARGTWHTATPGPSPRLARARVNSWPLLHRRRRCLQALVRLDGRGHHLGGGRGGPRGCLRRRAPGARSPRLTAVVGPVVRVEATVTEGFALRGVPGCRVERAGHDGPATCSPTPSRPRFSWPA